MKKLIPMALAGCVVLATLCSCRKKDKKDDPPAPNAYATGGTNLLSFNINSPANAVTTVITGMQPGETLVGIDIRPLNSKLYGVGSTSRLYVIDPNTGAATVVGAPFAEPLQGTSFGVDFNPVADRLRIVSNTGQNIRVNAENGTLAGKDIAINPAGSNVSAVAYFNNIAGAATTFLYDVDATTDRLYRQEPPNNGSLTVVGQLGVNVEASNGFDISGVDKAYAIFTTGAATKLYKINLNSGAATAVGDFPSPVKGLALSLNL